MNFNQMNDNAAYALEGRVLKNNWKVIKRLEPKPGSTGGNFSVCYLVTNGDTTAFLKALNFKSFFAGQRINIIEIIQEQTNAFKFEKDLLLRCKANKLSKVATIIDEGQEWVEGFTIGDVPYLIFDLADGDIRTRINFDNRIESAWKLKSLHNVAVGLKQLHQVEIGHQDLKPSNVLLYNKGITSKIGDLGRSLCAAIEAPHEFEGSFTGDLSYAPPEFLYGYIEPDWSKRTKATDMYLFGSLIVFYFTGINMTALLGQNIDRQFLWGQWGGTFEEVKDYLKEGYYVALHQFRESIPRPLLAEELSKIVEICCFPSPERRGFLFNKNSRNQYDMHKIITKMDVLSRKVELNVI
jgi:serine/threonine protein kinase